MSFGQRLQAARKKKKLTQENVAKLLGKDYSSISKYENDKAEPDLETLLKLSSLYEIPVEELMQAKGYNADSSDKKKYVSEVTEKIIEKMVAKYNLDLTIPGNKDRLETLIQIIVSERD